MPQFILDIPNVEETVSAPLINTIVPRILNTIKIFSSNYDLRFGNWSETFVNKGSEIDYKSQTRSENRLPTDTVIKIEADERYNEDMSRGVHVREGVEKNIFTCDKTRTNMHAGYQPMIIDMSINITFTNRHQAESYRRKLRLASIKSVDGIEAKVKSTYTIPYQFVYILKHIHDLMENVHPYGISFGQWLRDNFVDNLTTLANQSGGKSVLSINEVSQNVLVLFNQPDDIPLKDKENDSGRWTISLPYTIYYDRPDVMRLRFQNQIHNQLVKKELLSKFTTKTGDELQAKANVNLYGAIRVGALPIIPNKLSGASSPVWDDWLQSVNIAHYPNLVRALISVDENDPTALIDLNDMSDWEFSPEMIAWLIDTCDTLSKKYFNIFYINYWEFDKLRSSELVSTDQTLMVRAKDPLNPRVSHHVTIGVCIDPTLLDQSVWDKLANHPWILKEYLTMLDPNLLTILDDFIKKFKEQYYTGEVGWHVYEWDGEFDWNKDKLPPRVIEDLKDLLEEKYRLAGLTFPKLKTVMIHGVCVFKNRGLINA